MTLTQLRHLVAIVDCGFNISLAAERVHATQPGLSKHLRHLEDELGFAMFNRRGRNLESLTLIGNRVVDSARAILAEVDRIRATVASLHDNTRSMLRVATTHTQARHALPATISRFSQHHKEISVHLQSISDMSLIDVLDNGEADVAIVSTSGGAPRTSGLAVPIYRWHRVIVTPRHHPLSQLPVPPTLKELATLPLISYDSSLRQESSLRQAFEKAGLHPNISLTASDADLIKTYVETGLGVGIVAEMAVSGADEERLAVVRANQLFPECTTWAVLRRASELRKPALAFLAEFAPQMDGSAVLRALERGTELPIAAADVPTWTQYQAAIRRRPSARKPKD